MTIGIGQSLARQIPTYSNQSWWITQGIGWIWESALTHRGGCESYFKRSPRVHLEIFLRRVPPYNQTQRMSPLVDKLDQQRHPQRIDLECLSTLRRKTALNHDVTIVHFKLSLEEEVFGECPIAMNTPLTSMDWYAVSLGRADLRTRDPMSSPKTSVSV